MLHQVSQTRSRNGLILTPALAPSQEQQTHTQTHALTHSLTRSLARSPTHARKHALSHSVTHLTSPHLTSLVQSHLLNQECLSNEGRTRFGHLSFQLSPGHMAASPQQLDVEIAAHAYHHPCKGSQETKDPKRMSRGWRRARQLLHERFHHVVDFCSVCCIPRFK